MEEIEITNVLLNDNLTVRETNIIKELFMLRTEPSFIIHKGKDYHKYDCNWDCRIKEIICTFKHYFLKGFKNPNDERLSWVKHEKHYVTRMLKKLAENQIKIRYNKAYKSLILYR